MVYWNNRWRVWEEEMKSSVGKGVCVQCSEMLLREFKTKVV